MEGAAERQGSNDRSFEQNQEWVGCISSPRWGEASTVSHTGLERWSHSRPGESSFVGAVSLTWIDSKYRPARFHVRGPNRSFARSMRLSKHPSQNGFCMYDVADVVSVMLLLQKRHRRTRSSICMTLPFPFSWYPVHAPT